LATHGLTGESTCGSYEARGGPRGVDLRLPGLCSVRTSRLRAPRCMKAEEKLKGSLPKGTTYLLLFMCFQVLSLPPCWQSPCVPMTHRPSKTLACVPTFETERESCTPTRDTWTQAHHLKEAHTQQPQTTRGGTNAPRCRRRRCNRCYTCRYFRNATHTRC